MPTSPHVPEGHFCVGSLECYFKCSRCNLPTAKLQRSSTLWNVYGEYCAAPQTSPHPQMLQLSAEILRTSSHFTALLHSRCRSETLLANRVNKFPFIGVSLTKQKSLSVLQSTPFLSWRTHGVFSGQIRIWTRVNMCRRGWGWDQGVNNIQAGLSVQYTSCRYRNNGASSPNKRN